MNYVELAEGNDLHYSVYSFNPAASLGAFTWNVPNVMEVYLTSMRPISFNVINGTAEEAVMVISTQLVPPDVPLLEVAMVGNVPLNVDFENGMKIVASSRCPFYGKIPLKPGTQLTIEGFSFSSISPPPADVPGAAYQWSIRIVR